MMRLLSLASLLLAAGIALIAESRAQFTYFYVPAPVTASFTGIGDVVGGWQGSWGTIANKASSASANAFDLCLSTNGGTSDLGCITVPYVNGIVSSTQVVAGVTCGTTTNVDECSVKQTYDTSGATNCSSAPCTLVDVGVYSRRPKFVPNYSGTVPGLKCTGTSVLLQNQTNPAGAGITLVSSLSIPGTPSGFNWVIGGNGGVALGTGNGTTNAVMFAGAVVSGGSMSTGALHALIGRSSGSSSGGIYLDGTQTTGNTSNNTMGTQPAICAQGAGSNPFTGTFLQAAWINSDQSANAAGINTNMHSNGGF